MREISKLRARLKNVGKGVVEYKMPLIDAKNLLAEIEELILTKSKEVYIEVPVEVVKSEPVSPKMDGGSFTDF